MAVGWALGAVLIVVGLACLAFRHARVTRSRLRPVEGQGSSGDTIVDRDRYVILRPNMNSPYTLSGKRVRSRVWKGEGPYFMIWDRRMRRWIDGAFTTRELAERRLDDLTKTRRAQTRPAPQASLGQGDP